MLGNGDTALEEAVLAAVPAHPGQVAAKLGYDESFAHRIFAGSDVTLVPSRFEPCGLTQMYGLKYGSLPLVRRVGGLADTVVDSDLETLTDHTATGFVFNDFDEADFRRAVRRSLPSTSARRSGRASARLACDLRLTGIAQPASTPACTKRLFLPDLLNWLI